MIVVDAPVHHDVYLKRVHTLTINILSIKDSLAIPNAILTVLNVENATGVSDEMGKIRITSYNVCYTKLLRLVFSIHLAKNVLVNLYDSFETCLSG